jgi:sec-independent protein translocase protein TatA
MRLGIWEILLILIVAMLFFGPKRLTDLGPALGKSIRGFKKGLSGDDDHAADGHGHGDAPPPASGNTRP